MDGASGRVSESSANNFVGDFFFAYTDIIGRDTSTQRLLDASIEYTTNTL